MGVKAEEKLEIARGELPGYLMANHSVYVELAGKLYYLTDVNDQYWRFQDPDILNEKGHFTDCSELVPLVSEIVSLQVADGKSLANAFDEAVFYASVKE